MPPHATTISPPPAGISNTMDENKARRVVDALRERGTDADLARVGVYQFGVNIRLPDGREATWDSDGTAALEAQVMRNGMLVGYVPVIEGSDSYTEEQVIDAILRTDYDKPIATRRATAPPPAPALPQQGRALPPVHGRVPLPLRTRDPRTSEDSCSNTPTRREAPTLLRAIERELPGTATTTGFGRPNRVRRSAGNANIDRTAVPVPHTRDRRPLRTLPPAWTATPRRTA